MNLEKYRQIFFDETSDELNSLENLILQIEKTSSDTEAIHSIFRLFHRLKSSSAMMGLINFSELSHRAEDLLALIKEGKIGIGKDIVTILLSIIDCMRQFIREAEAGDIKGSRPEDLLNRIKEICDGEHDNVIAPEDRNVSSQNAKIREVSADIPVNQIHHGLNLIRINEVEVNDLIDMAGELISTLSELDRVIALLDNVSSLKEAQSINHNINNIKRKSEKLSLSIHNHLLKSKMVPTGEMFERLKRVIHDLSVKMNKCTQVLLNGAEIELDRAIVDKLFNPLLHVVRNAVDHGLEDEVERLQNGKSPISTLTISATLEGHYVTISVMDDGRGIDSDSIKREILKRGLLDKKGIETLTEKEITDYLFLPGFSTKKEATDISGRGMGLDIVRENVKELKGMVDISTQRGLGTTVKITIPQTLTIIRCLQTSIGDKIYSMPTESILEIIPYRSAALTTVNSRPLLIYRGSPIPIVDLWRELDIRHDQSSITSHIIIGNMNAKTAIPVSNVLGEQDILIKHLGRYFSNVVGILGVGILGGGRLSLIMDTDFILQQYTAGRLENETAASA